MAVRAKVTRRVRRVLSQMCNAIIAIRKGIISEIVVRCGRIRPNETRQQPVFGRLRTVIRRRTRRAKLSPALLVLLQAHLPCQVCEKHSYRSHEESA